MFNKYNDLLGKNISRLCYGTLTIGPLQRGFDSSYGASLLKKAFDLGINFYDTAEIYDNYDHIKKFLQMDINRENVIISTKSYAYDEATAKASLTKALEEMETDYIDMFLLHEQESSHTLRGHYEAIEYFLKAKEKGLIRAFGISTHNLEALEAVLKVDYIDVVHAIVNQKGFGIVDGSIEEMLDLLIKLKEKNIFIYGMKPLGGGHLINSYKESMDFVLNIEELDSIAIGMQSESEIKANVLYASGRVVPSEVFEDIESIDRKLLIHDWCIGCGKCVERCQQHALKLVNEKATVDQSKCVMCGYCAATCPELCIKVI